MILRKVEEGAVGSYSLTRFARGESAHDLAWRSFNSRLYSCRSAAALSGSGFLRMRGREATSLLVPKEASFANESTFSLPGMPTWAGDHWNLMVAFCFRSGLVRAAYRRWISRTR